MTTSLAERPTEANTPGRPLTAILQDIITLPPDWHGAGSLGAGPLEAFVRHAPARVARSIETGAGKSTLLLSHMSERHTVFAMDGGSSVSVTRSSGLLNRTRVDFVDGPTQQTLLAHDFREPLDLVLLDGPHGYPFPQLEYWAVYRHIRPGGLLVVDDIHIPTIWQLFEFLREEPMFELLEVVLNTAFFRRTSAPTLNPYGDCWVDQPYNTSRFPVNVTAHAPTTPSLESYYRPRLLPLIESWRAAGTRVAVFGIGGHTERLFSLVPELAEINLVAFLDSDPRKQHDTYRGHAVRAPEWAGGNCDVVLCSSFEHETAQMAMLDRVPVKVVPSHLQAVTVSGRRPGW